MAIPSTTSHMNPDLVAAIAAILPDYLSNDVEGADAVYHHARHIAAVLPDLTSVPTVQEALQFWSQLHSNTKSCLNFESFAIILVHLNQVPATLAIPKSADTMPAHLLELDETIKDAWARYHLGEFAPSLDVILTFSPLEGVDYPQEKLSELRAISAWNHYRQHHYEEALESIREAENFPVALECEWYIRQFIEEYRDEARISELRDIVGSTIAGANGTLIRARSLDEIPYYLVEELVFQYKETVDQTAPPVAFANLLHNAGRAYMEKPRDFGDLDRAIILLNESLVAYGTGPEHPHHKAAANFWISKALAAKGEIDAAIDASERSVEMWLRQIRLDTRNPKNLDKLINVRDHLKELRKLKAAA